MQTCKQLQLGGSQFVRAEIYLQTVANLRAEISSEGDLKLKVIFMGQVPGALTAVS
jgi:hypothetical protein